MGVSGMIESALEVGAFKELNKQLIKAACKGGAGAVLDILSEHIMSMNGLNLATALHRIAKSCCKADATAAAVGSNVELYTYPAFGLLLQRLTIAAEDAVNRDSEEIPECAWDVCLPSDSIGIVVWSLACLDIYDSRLLEHLALLAISNVECFQTHQKVNIVWGFARLGVAHQHPTLFQVVSRHVHRRAPGAFKAHTLALAAWAFAKAELPDVKVFESLVAELSGQIHGLNEQTVSDLSWAFTKQKMPIPPEVIPLLVSSTIFENMDGCQLCNTLRSYLASGLDSSPDFLCRIAKAASDKLSDMVFSQLALLLVAYAHDRNLIYPQLIPPLFAMLIDKAPSASTQELAFVTLHAAQGYPFDRRFCDVFGACTILRIWEFEDSDLITLASAFGSWTDFWPSAAWVVDEIEDECSSRAEAAAAPGNAR